VNRRSFLAAITGALAAERTAKATKLWKGASPTARAFRATQPDVLRHFYVRDSVLVVPDTLIDDTIFPPPVPNECAVTKIAVWFKPDVPVGEIAAVSRDLCLDFRIREKQYFAGPLYTLSLLGGSELPRPFGIRNGDAFSVRFHSVSPAQNRNPVQVFVGLYGLVRV